MIDSEGMLIRFLLVTPAFIFYICALIRISVRLRSPTDEAGALPAFTESALRLKWKFLNGAPFPAVVF
jgi:hypothetical protein